MSIRVILIKVLLIFAAFINLYIFWEFILSFIIKHSLVIFEIILLWYALILPYLRFKIRIIIDFF